MKFTIKKEILNEKLNLVSKAISTKIIIPVLSGIKLDLKKEGLFLTASNDDIAIETFIEKKSIKKIEETGTIVVPGIYFLQIIRKIEDSEITIETDGLKIILSTKIGEYTLNGMNSNEFPNLKFELLEKPVIIKEKILKNIVNQTVFAVSSQENRPVLTGINFQLTDDNLVCTATDSYRLAKKIVKLDDKYDLNINIVIPGRNLIELIKVLNDDESDIELHIFSNNILIKTDDLLFQSRLLNDRYPDVSKLIPDEFEISLKTNLEELYNSIDRVSLLTSEKEKNLVKMTLDNNILTLSSTSQEIGKMEEQIKLKNETNKNITIAYSSKYMLEALRSLKSENVEIKLNSEIKPIIIKEEDNDNLVQLVLPIKTF